MCKYFQSMENETEPEKHESTGNQLDTFAELSSLEKSFPKGISVAEKVIESVVPKEIVLNDQFEIPESEQVFPGLDMVVVDASKTEKNREKKRKAKEKKTREKKMKMENQVSEWVDTKVNTNLYVTGLPPTMTLEEFTSPFVKYGMLKVDLETGLPKAKLYKNSDGTNKGDGVIHYLRAESIDLAMQFLDANEIAPGYSIKIQPAVFQKKEAFVPQKKSTKKMIDARLNWDDDEKGVEIIDVGGPVDVIIKNMFTLDSFAKDPLFESDLKTDIKSECDKLGPTDRIKIFKHHPDGVVQIRFTTNANAKKCIELFNGRFFDGKKLESFFWDGIVDYNIKADEEDDQERWEKFGENLETK